VPQKPEISVTEPQEFARELRQAADLLPNRINIDAESVEQGLAKLVLTLIEFIRRLLEAQALRRMEGRDLTPRQIEELGLALMKLESRMKDLKAEFGLSDDDLNLNLGPLGRLM
jgi:Gas vesicle protein K